MGRYDANFGNVLSILKNRKMTVEPLGELKMHGQVRRIRQVKVGGRRGFVFVKSDAEASLVFQVGR